MTKKKKKINKKEFDKLTDSILERDSKKEKKKKKSQKLKKKKNSFIIYPILIIIVIISFFSLMDEVKIIRLESTNFWWFFFGWSIFTIPITLNYHLKRINELYLANIIIGILFASIVSTGLSFGSQIPFDNLSKKYSINNPVEKFDLKITSVNYRRSGCNLWYDFKDTNQVIHSSEKKWLNISENRELRIMLNVRKGLGNDYIIEKVEIYEKQ